MVEGLRYSHPFILEGRTLRHPALYDGGRQSDGWVLTSVPSVSDGWVLTPVPSAAVVTEERQDSTSAVCSRKASNGRPVARGIGGYRGHISAFTRQEQSLL